MGYTLSSIAKLPIDVENDFYIFVVGGNENWNGGSLQLVYDNFDLLAKEIGPNAIIAKGINPQEWSYELSQKYFGDNREIDILFPGIIITDTHPDNFKDSDFCILISLAQIEQKFDNFEQFFNLLTNFVSEKDERFFYFVNKKIDWYDKANNMIDLKPNFFGIGINFNALIENLKK